MSIHEINRMSTLDPGQDGTTVRETAEAESQRIGGNGGHGQNPAEKEVEFAAAPPTSATAANMKTFFGMKRANPTVKKGMKTTAFPLVSH